MAETQEKIIQIAGSITVDELAEALGLSVTALIGELFKQGIMATINQRLDFDTASLIETGKCEIRTQKYCDKDLEFPQGIIRESGLTSTSSSCDGSR